MSRDWLEELDPEDRSRWEEFVDHFRRDAVSKISESGLFISLVPGEDFDVKFAVELGTAVMLDKPILAIVMPGFQPSKHLLRVADQVIEADLDTEDGQIEIAKAIKELIPGS